MAKVSANITLDTEDMERAQKLFADLGLNLSTAINLFLKQSIRENAIPFSIQREVPNADTIAAIKEIEEMEKHPEEYKSYSSFAELVNEVMQDV